MSWNVRELSSEVASFVERRVRARRSADEWLKFKLTALIVALVVSISFLGGQLTATRQRVRDMAANVQTLERENSNLTSEIATLRSSAIDPQKMMADVREDLRREFGWMPIDEMRKHLANFVELYATNAANGTTYGSATYLGRGYFLTVKHAVVALPDPNPNVVVPPITQIMVMVGGTQKPAVLVDTGNAEVEVDSGDWAVIRVNGPLSGLVPVTLNLQAKLQSADQVYRFGNDYSKGIVSVSGYLGQPTSNGLFTALTDGHPGVSGGGVLNSRGELVAIPIGRMTGDYRFSFILPLRPEMLRKVHLG